MKQSEKLGLNLPEDDDFFDVEHQNENMRKLDEKIGDVKKYAEHLKDKNVHVTEEKQKKWDAVEDKVDKLEAAEIKMLGWSVPRVCPIQNEVNNIRLIQKVGRVDLGELEWQYEKEYNVFHSYSIKGNMAAKVPADGNEAVKGFCRNYTVIGLAPLGNSTNMSIAMGLNGTEIYISNHNYSDASAFKQAMQGQYLYYELANYIAKTIDGNEIGETVSDVRKETTVNLLKPTLQTTTRNGVTFTNNEDGTYTLNGTASAAVFMTIGSCTIKDNQYKLLGCPSTGGYEKYVLSLSDKLQSDATDAGNGVILQKEAARYSITIGIWKDTPLNNVVFKPMLTTNLSATYDDFVPYTGDTGRLNGDVAELNDKKADKSETTVNLLNPTLQTTTKNGVTCTNNGDGTYTLKGTNSSDVQFSFIIGNVTIINNDRYKLVGSPSNTSMNTARMFLTNADWSISIGDIINGGIMILPSDTYDIHINVKGNETVNYTFKPMLTTNLSATYDDFVPYTGNTGSLKGDVADVRKDVDSKLSKANVVNNLITTESGFALDAMQGYTLDKKITDLKKSVSDGKSAVASAITLNGVSTASDASFTTMAENIGNIFYKRLGKQLTKYFYSRVSATNGSNGAQNVYRNTNTTTDRNWLGHETFFGGSLTDMNGCIIITWLKGTSECAFTIMRLKSEYLGVNNFENLFENNLKYQQMDDGTITLVSKFITPGIEINTLCLACHN